MIKLALADDHNILREGIASVLKESGQVEIVKDVGSVKEVKILLDRHPEIEILLCDINFPDGDGYEVLAYIKKYNMATKVIMLTMHDKSSYATKALEAGALGYLTKDTAKDELISAILSVKNGNKYFGQRIMNNIVENMNKPQENHDFFKKVLSKRELEVLELIVEGLDTNEIANKLFISEKTVANYRNSILQKCDIKNIVQLIKFYLQNV